MSFASTFTWLSWTLVLCGTHAALFKRPQFGDGMILQRGTGTRVFGSNATGEKLKPQLRMGG